MIDFKLTDAQIRALRDDPATPKGIRIACKIALDEGAVHVRASAIKSARERVAKYIVNNGGKLS